MSASKKRQAGDGGFVQEDDSIARKHKKMTGVHSSPLAKVSHSQFLEDKKSLWQQGMEDLNLTIKEKMRTAQTDEDVLFLSMEYVRVSRYHKRLFNPTVGQVVAMGMDDAYQLGIAASPDDDKECNYPPTLVTQAGKNITHVACGGLHSLALTEDGKVYSWGVNDDDALGRGKIHEDKAHLVEQITKGFEEQDRNAVVAIAAGDSHSTFLTIRGNVYTCGMYKDMDSGKFRDIPLGSNESPKGSNVYPIKVNLPGNVVDIAAGLSFNAAIMEDGQLYTWGMGHNGQLARSKTMGAEIKKLDKFGAHTMYELGKMWIGEEYGTGQYEKNDDGSWKIDPDTGNRIEIKAYRYHLDLIKNKFLKPAPVCWADPSPQRSVLSVACGELFLVVVARDGGYDTSVYSAGHNGMGQLGLGIESDIAYEVHELTKIKALERKLIKKVAAGTSHALALDMGGNAVYAWGRAEYGQIGHADGKPDENVSTPTQIAFPSEIENVRIMDIAAGSYSSMAITEEHDVYTWGFAETCATGHMVANDITRPRKVDVLKKSLGSQGKPTNCHVLQASCGGQHSLMVIKRFA